MSAGNRPNAKIIKFPARGDAGSARQAQQAFDEGWVLLETEFARQLLHASEIQGLLSAESTTGHG